MIEQRHVVVVDDHELFRRGVIEALRATEDFVVDGEAATAREALRLGRLLMPDLILLDIGLPDTDGIAVVSELLRESSKSRVVMLTASEDERSLLRAVHEGAAGYILKGIAADELVRALRVIDAGDGYVSPKMAAYLLREVGRDEPDRSPAGLSQREREVLEGIAKGRTNREIADELHLSEKTIKYYVTNIFVKTRTRNRVEAALKAEHFRAR